MVVGENRTEMPLIITGLEICTSLANSSGEGGFSKISIPEPFKSRYHIDMV